jgi:hypothetical protein
MIKNFEKFFSLKEYIFDEQKFFYYGISDNYKLDEFCTNFFYKFKRNPYFINKWYAMDFAHKFILNDLYNLNFDSIILEMGTGLGISPVFFEKNGFSTVSFDFEFYSIYLTQRTQNVNGIKSNKIVVNDWNYSCFKNKFDAIVGIDIIYDKENVEPITTFIQSQLAKNGFFYIANFENYAYDLLIKKLTESFQLIEKKTEMNLTQKIVVCKFYNN